MDSVKNTRDCLANPRNYNLFFAGYLQGRFGSMIFGSIGSSGGIDLKIKVDDEGIHGKYLDSEFSAKFSSFPKDPLKWRFQLKITVPKSTGLIERACVSSSDKLSRIIGETVYKQRQEEPDKEHDCYEVTCVIGRHTDHIKSPNDLAHDILQYLVREPFVRLQRSKK